MNMLDLEKAQRLSLTQQVEVSLKNELIVGALKPGARLITKEIADQLGTSITPVREALLRLVSAGALHATPAQAFLVPEVSQQTFIEITEIRKRLESMAVSAACSKMTEDKLRQLRLLANTFNESRVGGNVEQALQANRTFRFRLYECAEMPTLFSLIEQLWVRIGPCFNYLYPISDDLAKGHHDYADLLEALERGDSEACQNAILCVIDMGVNIVQQQYKSAP